MSVRRGDGLVAGSVGQLCCSESKLLLLRFAQLVCVRLATMFTFFGTFTFFAATLRCAIFGSLSVQCGSAGLVCLGGVFNQRFVPMKCDLTSSFTPSPTTLQELYARAESQTMAVVSCVGGGCGDVVPIRFVDGTGIRLFAELKHWKLLAR